MEETSEELPNFCISIDFLGPDPTSSKNKAEKNRLTQLTGSSVLAQTTVLKGKFSAELYTFC